MKLQTKLMLAPGVTGALLVVVVAASLWLLNAFQADSRRSHDAVLAANAHVADAQAQLGALHTQLYRTMTIIGSMDDAAVKATREQQAHALDGIVARIGAQADATQDASLQQTLRGFAAQALKYRTAADNAIDLATVDPNTGVAALQTADAIFKALGKSLADMTEHVQAGAKAEAAALDASATRGALAIGAIGALTVVLSIAFAWTVQRRIAAGIVGAAQTAAEVAAGQLNRRPHSDADDEVGALLRALGAMVEHLRQSIGAVQSAAESIGTASGEIASGSADLSQRTEEAASSLQQTASSMEQLTGTVKQSAESASTAHQLAGSAAQAAQRGGVIVSEVVATMDQINASSKRIADIIGVIDGIAFQTNILALNAAVEAARAGEQGRGFAVVAGEVRALAQRSAEAAKEIKALIGTSVGKVEAGSRLVTSAGATMNEIVVSVQRVSDVIGEISAASSEQSSGIGQVNVAVTQLDQMTQQNAALVEQSTAAAESLQEQARTLANVVAAFRLAGGVATVRG